MEWTICAREKPRPPDKADAGDDIGHDLGPRWFSQTDAKVDKRCPAHRDEYFSAQSCLSLAILALSANQRAEDESRDETHGAVGQGDDMSAVGAEISVLPEETRVGAPPEAAQRGEERRWCHRFVEIVPERPMGESLFSERARGRVLRRQSRNWGPTAFLSGKISSARAVSARVELLRGFPESEEIDFEWRQFGGGARWGLCRWISRKRVVLAVGEEGMSCRAAARRFGVSFASAIRWVAALRERGSYAALPMGGDTRSQRVEAHGDDLLRLHRREPDLTLAEICARLERTRGEKVSPSMIWRFFDRHDITFKAATAR